MSKLIEPILRALSRLPFGLLYFISDLLAPLIYHVVRYRRRTVRENIDRSFPNRPTCERRLIERRFYRFFCDYVVETIKLMTISEEEMRRRMKFYGCEEMDCVLDKQPFNFLMLGHYANWEWISTFGMWTTRHCEQLYTPLHNKTMDAIFYKMRTRFGAENVSKYDVMRHLVKERRDGVRSHVGFIADQSPRPQNIHHWMKFLHQDTPTFTGAERLGKKLGAAAYFAHITRPRRGYYECQLELLTEDMSRFTDYEFTELYMRRLEREIQEAPHLWLWSHKRWKYAGCKAETIAEGRVK